MMALPKKQQFWVDSVQEHIFWTETSGTDRLPITAQLDVEMYLHCRLCSQSLKFCKNVANIMSERVQSWTAIASLTTQSTTTNAITPPDSVLSGLSSTNPLDHPSRTPQPFNPEHLLQPALQQRPLTPCRHRCRIARSVVSLCISNVSVRRASTSPTSCVTSLTENRVYLTALSLKPFVQPDNWRHV